VGITSLDWHDFRHTYRAMMDELKISLEEQRALINARVVEMLRKRA
jgi:hypothetical protein